MSNVIPLFAEPSDCTLNLDTLSRTTRRFVNTIIDDETKTPIQISDFINNCTNAASIYQSGISSEIWSNIMTSILNDNNIENINFHFFDATLNQPFCLSKTIYQSSENKYSIYTFYQYHYLYWSLTGENDGQAKFDVNLYKKYYKYAIMNKRDIDTTPSNIGHFGHGC